MSVSGKMFDAIIDSAQAHGEAGEFEDGATHEVGDLQEAFRFAWDLLTVEQQRKVYEEFKAEVADEPEDMPEFPEK